MYNEKRQVLDDNHNEINSYANVEIKTFDLHSVKVHVPDPDTLRTLIVSSYKLFLMAQESHKFFRCFHTTVTSSFFPTYLDCPSAPSSAAGTSERKKSEPVRSHRWPRGCR